MTKTSAVYNLYTQEASCVMSENSSINETSAVHNLYTQEVSCNKNDESVISETDSTTKTSAVYNLYIQEPSCVMLKEIIDVTEVYIMWYLFTQEVSWDSVRRFRYAESQQHSIKNSVADTAAMNINDTVNYAFISL